MKQGKVATKKAFIWPSGSTEIQVRYPIPELSRISTKNRVYFP